MKKLNIFILLILFSSYISAQSPAWQWAKSSDGIYDSISSKGITIDASGNIIVTGSFSSQTITFGNITLTKANSSNNSPDIFVVKYNSDGDVLWAIREGGNNSDYSYKTTTDQEGNIFITGLFFGISTTLGSTIYNNTTTITKSDIFIIKYNSDGQFLWAKTLGSAGNDEPSGIATDSAGNVALSGYFTGQTFTVDGTQISNKDTILPSNDIFMVKYNTNGDLVWANSYGGVGAESSSGLCINSDNSIILTGIQHTNTVSIFNLNPLVTITGGCGFIAKINSEGQAIWAKSIGNSGCVTSSTCAVNLTGDIAITGTFGSETLVFGENILTNLDPEPIDPFTTRSDIFVAKYDANGNYIWAKSAGGNREDFSNGVAIDVAGNQYIIGASQSQTINFDSQTISNLFMSNYDGFVTKYASNGDVLFAKAMSGENHAYGFDIALNAAQNIFVTGIFQDFPLTLGSTTLPTQSVSGNFFTAKLENLLASKTFDNNSPKNFPNPTSDHITITFGESQGTYIITLQTILGQTVSKKTISGVREVTYPIENEKGIYLLTIENEKGETSTQKIIKK